MTTVSAATQNQGDTPPRIACARCGATIACEPTGDCWCKHEPVRLPMPVTDKGCLCANCLRDAASPGA